MTIYGVFEVFFFLNDKMIVIRKAEWGHAVVIISLILNKRSQNRIF